METLAEILKSARDNKSLLLREVAAAIGADTAMISKFEKGERKPTRNQISLLAKFLEINEKQLLIIFLSDKVANELVNEDVAREALEAALEKVDFLQRKQTFR
ncbi:helix-turn-helix domain-containing protein [Dyadobacter sp. CY356]|uniref:helix-turn-helix domain-containing protein n=1 Tax=Dyadobacter sp. CY356 TaxID=2906442 RepID=UPI001F48D339|nr:helix-turn-helix transcriptional regulator [Dyadobacter sp. CY356]MCF0057169.1 helix-turn-helix domain-containing protein [Dyadobacter sp. CY356]